MTRLVQTDATHRCQHEHGERGWVERVRSTRARRAQHIHLTTAGAQLVLRAEKIAATMEVPSLAVSSVAERALLIELLHKVASGRGGKR